MCLCTEYCYKGVSEKVLVFFWLLRAKLRIFKVKNNSEILNWAVNILIPASSFVLHAGVIFLTQKYK